MSLVVCTRKIVRPISRVLTLQIVSEAEDGAQSTESVSPPPPPTLEEDKGKRGGKYVWYRV